MNKFAQKIGLSLLLTSGITLNAWADDVEIYFNDVTETSTTGDPLVMFSLDYRSNLTAPISGCSNVEACNITYLDDNDTPDDPTDDQSLTTSLTDYWNGVSPASIVNYDETMAELAAGFTYADRYDDNGTPGDTSDDIAGEIDFLELLRAALRVVLNSITDVKVGLMLSHDNINNCEGPSNENTDGCSNGGYIAMGFQEVDGDASTSGGDDVLLAKLAALPSPQGNYSHPYQGAELYFELFRYLTGQAIYNGHVGRSDYADPCDVDNLDDTETPTDPACNGVGSHPDDTDVDPLISWDATTTGINAVENTDHDTYVSPFENDDTECAGVYAVNLMFGVSNQDSDSNDAINADAPTGMGAGTASNNNAFRDTIGWLFKNGADYRDLASNGNPYGIPERKGNQNVTSYFLFKGNVANTMNSYAGVGGSTKAIEVTEDPKALIEVLKGIFESFKRQNSTFEAPAVTVNSYSSLTHRDELYYALFAPEQNPNWPGNLKKYKLIEVPKDDNDDGITDWIDTVVGDANADPAVAEQSELFLPEACSFWTNCSTPVRDCDGDNDIDSDDVCADGDQIEWGGAAEELTTTRKVFTDFTGDSNVDLTDTDNAVHEDNTNITAAMLGIDTTNATDFSDPPDGVDATDVAAERQRLLRIGRGVNPNDPTEVTFALGDPIHARPTVIEYDSDVNTSSNTGDAPDLAIAMTDNEGFFHLIKESDGTEYFSYIPEDLLPLLGQINGPTQKPLDTEPGGTAKGANRYNTYGLDGSPVVWAHDYNHDGDLLDTNADADLDAEDYVLAFLTQRRGGSSMYALDITNKTSPRLLWKIHGARSYDDDVSPSTTSGFDRLGQTWSEPARAVIKVANGDEEKIPTPVLIFGGGYDDIKVNAGDLDNDDGYYTSDGAGRAIYVVDAETGNRRWTISADNDADLKIDEMLSGIPAKVRVLDIDNDNYVDRIYAVDVIGRVFRIDLDNSGDTTTLYSGGMVADLHDPFCPQGPPVGGVAETCQRRFFNAPDVALQIGFPIAPYYQIAVGSGYRPFPVSVPGIQNQFYMLFDTNVTNKIHPNGYGTGTYTDGGETYDQQYHWEITASDATSNLVNVTYYPDTSNNATLGDAIFSAEEALLGENKHGWYFNMNIFYNIADDNDPDNGTTDMSLNEHVLSEAVTLQGLTFFTTYLQDSNATNECKVNLGQGRAYVVDSFTGLPVADLVNGTPLSESDSTSTTHRFNPLDRTGIPTDPLVVFRENSEGEIDPVVIVGSDLPLTGKEGLLEKNAYTKTWWIDVE